MTDLIVSPKFFDNDHTNAIDVMRKHWEQERAHIMNDARAKIRDEVREEFCRVFGVVRYEERDDEGGGYVTLRFPEGWSEDQATVFAEDCIDLDLSSRYGGPGRYFQDGGIGTGDDGRVRISIHWGLDI